MTFQNDEDRIPKTSCGFYSQPQASVVYNPGSECQEAILVHIKTFLEFQSTPGYHCSNKKIPVDIRSANYFLIRVHRIPCLIWADDDHSCVQLHIRVQRRIWASARSWLSLRRDQVSGRRSAFTAHISLAYSSMGFSCFGYDPRLRIMGSLRLIFVAE